MDILQWFVTHFHWLYIFALLLTILSIIYLSCSFLGTNLPKRIIQSFAFGIVGGLVGTIVCLLIILLLFILTLIFYFKKAEIYQAIDINQVALTSLSLTIFLGLMIGVLSDPKRQAHSSNQKKFQVRKMHKSINWKRNVYLFSTGFLLAIFFTVYMANLSLVANPQSITTSLVAEVDNSLNYLNFFSFGYGFVIGFLYDKTNIKWKYCIIFFIFIFFIFSFLFELPGQGTEHNNFIYYFIQFVEFQTIGYLQGAIFNRSRNTEESLKEGSWGFFFLYAMIGIVCAVVFCLYSQILLQSLDFTQFAISVGLLIAFGRGDGNKLIQQLKPKINTKTGKIWLTKESWKRFVRSFIIGFINYIIYSSLYFLFRNFGQYHELHDVLDFSGLISLLGPFLFIIVFLYWWLSTALLFGLFTGTIYSLGPALAIYIDRISETRMLKIGALLATLAAFAAVLPSLIG